ncbi:hypothetical protein ACFL96_18540 [Thermoproteota archaeon]
MNIEEACKKGNMGMEDLLQFIISKQPMRTHLLKQGDYLALALVGAGNVHLEEIAEMDSPEKGDFTTVNGTQGPVRGNVFIKIDKEHYPGHFLLEGDGVTQGSGSVYDALNEYVAHRKVNE